MCHNFSPPLHQRTHRQFLSLTPFPSMSLLRFFAPRHGGGELKGDSLSYICLSIREKIRRRNIKWRWCFQETNRFTSYLLWKNSMFSKVKQLVSCAIQIFLSMLLGTNVNFSRPHFTTRQEEGYSSDGFGGGSSLFALLCDCNFLPSKVCFAKPAEKLGQLLFCACVYLDCQINFYGRIFAEISETSHRPCNFCEKYKDISVKGMGTQCRQPCASLNPCKGNKKLGNLEREFCTTTYAAVMSGWWSCSTFDRERLFLLLLEVTEKQLQTCHSRKGDLTCQNFKTFLF